MRRFLGIVGKILLGLLLLIVVAVVGVVGAANAKLAKKWTAHDATFPIPFPRPGEAVADSAARAQAIARGEMLIATRTPCSDCHGKDFGGSVVVGKSPVEQLMFGYWAAPNLTAGKGSVTRDFTAHDWDLAVRHGIMKDGHTSSMPAMEFKGLSDHELSDIVTYIQSKPPVDRDLGKPRLGLVFSIAVMTDPTLITAPSVDHQAAHAVEPPDSLNPIALGQHIALSCTGCHGVNYSGGKMPDPNMPVVANLTPDTSGVKGWTEADFLRAMHEGVKPDGTRLKDAMPWRVYGKMGDTNLKAVWAFLQTLPPTPKGVRK